MEANVKLLSLTDSTADKDEVFMNSVEFVLGNWPAIRLSVDQCFGGQCSNEKERWLHEVIFNVFMENDLLDPLDIEDYLAEILNNEFNVIIEDGSLSKVSEKLCSYYQLCKKGEHMKVAEEIQSIRLPKMNVRSKDNCSHDDMEVQEEVTEQLEDLSLKECEDSHFPVTDDLCKDINGANDCSHNEDKENGEHEGWVVVQRTRKKRYMP